MNIYDFEVETIKGEKKSIADYKGKVLLIVNSATKCGFTKQYDELRDMYNDYVDKGFEILDFPCNQFMNQAPENSEEIHSFCTMRYDIKFPQFAKLDVIGDNIHPLFKYLSENTTFKGFGNGMKMAALKMAVKKVDKDYENNSNIKWNFTKFLIDREGKIVERYEPTEGVDVIRTKIEELL